MKVAFPTSWIAVAFAVTAPASTLYVSNGTLNPGEVLEFDSNTGAYEGVFSPGGGGTAGIGAARQPFFGPDGNFYLVDALNQDVQRFTPSGTPLGVFATGNLPVPGVGAAFGPDGNLYVSDQGNGTVVKFNGITGALIGTLASVSSVSGILFSPDGSLLATRVNAGVVKIDATTGNETTFIASGSGGLNGTQDGAYGPDGNLYLTSFLGGQVLEYNGSTGAFIKVFIASINTPRGIAFGPDGDLYVVDVTDNVVSKYDGSTGAFISNIASGNGLSAPNYITFASTPSAAVPEPDSLFLAFLGLTAIVTSRRSRR
jgi:WD40 repeat protein